VSSQTRIVAGAVALVIALAGFWLLLIAPKRSETSAVQGKVEQAQSRRDAATAAAATAEQAKAGYQRDYAVVAKLGKAVPADDDVASLVYQLETIARAGKIDFRAVKLTGAAGAPPPTTTTSGAAAKDSKDGKDTSAAASTAPVAPVVAQPPPGTVVGAAGLLTVPFTFTFDGGYLKLQRFLNSINSMAKNSKNQIKVNGRLLTIDGFSLAASSKGFPKLKALVSATAYLVPEQDEPSVSTTPPAGAATGSSGTTAMVTPNAQGAGR
jgi:hypothetical protein